jgi:hypothetical protein
MYKRWRMIVRKTLKEISKDLGVKMEFEIIWVFPTVNFDPVAIGFAEEAVKESWLS